MTQSPSPQPAISRSDDASAILAGAALLVVGLISAAIGWLGDWPKNPLQQVVATAGNWTHSPLEGLSPTWPGILGAGAMLATAFAAVLTNRRLQFFVHFLPVFALALLADVLARQAVVRYYGLEYALWAILLGLVIANTTGWASAWRVALRTEMFMKTGLVLLGAEVLLGNLLALGLPGICVAWVVTPIVLISTYWFGQRVLRIESRSLNMVISADMSVCGVSAAIATAAACRAKKEELSVAIGISMAFTTIMMVVMPPVILALGFGPVLGGAWIGGTIDSTGAVGVAGSMLGEEALVVATTIKMIQNVLIGVVAFGVAVYWVGFVERSPESQPSLVEIWRRFPKFVLGFLGASVAFSCLAEWSDLGENLAATSTDITKVLRNWCFALAFVSIGLETRIGEVARYLRGGRPVLLYVLGQTLNLALTLAMAWVAFEYLFPGTADALHK